MTNSESRLYVAFTMDCERIKAFSPPGGPETWELSERAIRGFSEVLLAHDLVGTFFIVPETAHKHRDLFFELEEKGFELGMHLHPQSFGDLQHKDYLGAYSFQEQVDLLSQAVKVWAKAFGKRPKSFRPGNFSANDATFRALYEVGFRQGSVSAPERVMPKYRAVWAGTPPYAHHAHSYFRLIPGDLDFYEVPTTEDWDRRAWGGKSAMELRVEMAGIGDHRQTIDKRVVDMVEKQIPVKTIVAITHNYFEYRNPDDFHRRTLEGIAAYVWEAAERFGLEVCPRTLEQIHGVADSVRSKT
jgi:peptidoglycan/xylan/chitin deacetylase (PgdA/CDA1 family)